jgi:hypothetical protein
MVQSDYEVSGTEWIALRNFCCDNKKHLTPDKPYAEWANTIRVQCPGPVRFLTTLSASLDMSKYKPHDRYWLRSACIELQVVIASSCAFKLKVLVDGEAMSKLPAFRYSRAVQPPEVNELDLNEEAECPDIYKILLAIKEKCLGTVSDRRQRVETKWRNAWMNSEEDIEEYDRRLRELLNEYNDAISKEEPRRGDSDMRAKFLDPANHVLLSRYASVLANLKAVEMKRKLDLGQSYSPNDPLPADTHGYRYLLNSFTIFDLAQKAATATAYKTNTNLEANAVYSKQSGGGDKPGKNESGKASGGNANKSGNANNGGDNGGGRRKKKKKGKGDKNDSDSPDGSQPVKADRSSSSANSSSGSGNNSGGKKQAKGKPRSKLSREECIRRIKEKDEDFIK